MAGSQLLLVDDNQTSLAPTAVLKHAHLQDMFEFCL
jgi:hypothetical protein